MLYRSRPLPTQRVIASVPTVALPEVFVGIFLALLVDYLIFSQASTALLQFPDRSIGIGIMQGVDSSRRTKIYFLMVALSLGVWLGCYVGARAVRARWPGWFSGVRSSLENDVCAMLCALGSVALVSRVAADRLDGFARVHLALGGLGVVVFFALARRLSRPGPAGRLLRQVSAWSTVLPLVLLIWPAVQLGSIVRALSASSSPWPMRLGTMILPALYTIALCWLLRRPRQRTPAQIRKAFMVGAAPFLAFPALCPFANELQYALLPARAVDPTRIALLILAGLTLVAALLFVRTYRGTLEVVPSRLLARFCFPVVVFGAMMTMFHLNSLSTRQWDPLHDGEQITAIHQLLKFDRWPFVDVWPAHGLFDYVGYLYAKLNGFKPFELTAWNAIPAAFSATAVYAILASVSTPLFAFAATMVLPIDSIFPLPAYSFFSADPVLLGVGLLVVWALERPSTRRYVILSSAACLCFFWTPASGIASIASTLALLVVHCLTGGDRRAARRGLGVFIATGACLFIGYCLVLVLCQRPVFETLRQVLAYIRADPMLGSRAHIINQFDALAVFQYIVLPTIGMLYLAKLAHHVIERRPLGRVEIILGFLTITSFVLFVRTLARHCLAETYQPFFFPFLALAALMPGALNRELPGPQHSGESQGNIGLAHRLSRGALGRAWFCVGLALYVIAFPRVSRLREPIAAFTFHKWRAGEARYPGPTSFYPHLKAFLDKTLRPSDTFFELLNMPLLYTYFERELPGQFFLVSFFYGSDDVQDTYLKRLDAFGGTDRVPVVLLGSVEGPVHVDGVANTLRSYRIAERVFRDYLPFGMIDGFEVWVSRERWDEARRSAKPVPLSFAELDKFKTHSLATVSRQGDAVLLTSAGPDPQLDNAVRLDGVMLGDLASPNSLRFRYRTDVPGTLEVFYRYGSDGYDAEHSGRLWVRPNPSGEWQTGEVAIPLQAKAGLPLNGLRFDPPDNSRFELRSLELVFGEPPRRAPENTSLGMLPFIWGNFDARLAEGKGQLLEELSVRKSADNLSVDLVLRKAPDTSAGNYLRLCLRLPPAKVARATQPASWQSVKHGDSWQSAANIRLTYGGALASQFTFDLVRPDPASPGLPASLVESFENECKDYLIRLSSQYAWSSQKVRRLRLQSSTPFIVESAALLAGD